MKIGIVGGGAAGLFFALFLSSLQPDWHIEIYEKEERAGRKILATGNGHCNILNENPAPECYSDPLAGKYLAICGYETLHRALEEEGIYLQKRKEGIYPLTYSAASLLAYLLDVLSSRKVVFFTGFKAIDYVKSANGADVLLNHDTKRHVDFLVVSTGGKSSPKLGSDGSFFSVLSKHGYHIENLVPALSPIKVKEVGLGILKGIRHQSLVSIVSKGRSLYEERGEILFKEDGLSGIVAFNASSFLSWKRLWNSSAVVLDFFPDRTEVEIKKMEMRARSLGGRPLETIVEKNLAAYILKRSEREKKEPVAMLKNLVFHPSSSYGFNDSQVTHGGVVLDDVDLACHSRIEDGVGIIGEALNVDGKCGGYNLTWALATAYLLATSLKS